MDSMGKDLLRWVTYRKVVYEERVEHGEGVQEKVEG